MIIYTISLLLILQLSYAVYVIPSYGETSVSLIGRTPCCVDRLTALTCQRLSIKHPARFATQCMNNADFAFVQCCSSCFNRRFSNSSGLYADAVSRLINRPSMGGCRDVRGTEWCTRFAKRELETMIPEKGSQQSFWEPWFRQGCDAFPFAFRVCRQSCGFCTTGQKRATVSFNYAIATDKTYCPSNKAFSARINPDFDPLADLDLARWRKETGDYFVVVDHNYKDIEDDIVEEF